MMRVVQGRAGARDTLLVVTAMMGLLLAGCPSRGVVCAPGLEQCGNTCVDLRSDKANCSACGIACGSLQICGDGACACREGTTACNGTCSDVTSDDRNCGACGTVCGAGEVCADSVCTPAQSCGGATCAAGETCVNGTTCECSAGFTRCGTSCVDLSQNPDHCGACDAGCADVQTCSTGACTYALAATCNYTGQVVGLTGMGLTGPPVQAPVDMLQSLVAHRRNVLAGSTTTLMYQLGPTLTPLSGEFTTGASPIFAHSEPPYLFVVNSGANTLQVVKETGSMAPMVGGGFGQAEGLGFETVDELSLGENTSPQGVARVGNSLYVPLYGNFFPGGDVSAGQKIAVVDATDPEALVLGTPIDLSGLALQTYPDQTSVPGPFAIAAHQGNLYVALNNINPDTYGPGGPGLLAKVTLPGGEVSVVPLDHDNCENVFDVASVGDKLVVSCAGTARYGDVEPWPVVAIEKSSLVLLGADDALLATYPFACVGEGCTLAQSGRITVDGDRVLAGDAAAGRLVILRVTEGGFEELRGFSASSPQPPAQVCPAGSNNVGNIVVLQ